MIAARWLVVCAIVGSGPVAAQERDTVLLEEIVVSGTRFPVERRSVPARVQVIRGEELQRDGVTFVADALRQVAGVHVVQSGSFGAVASMFLRGGESDYVQVLIDGIPANDPGGRIDLADLTVDNVERIEIVRGPASVLYGSDAVTGVVQIFTRRGAGPERVSGQVRAGSFGTRDASMTAQGGHGQAALAVSLRHVASDGTLPFNNEYRNTTASGRLAVQLDETSVAFALRHTDAVFHFPTDGAGSLVDSNQFLANRMTSLSLDLERRIGPDTDVQITLGLNRTAGAGADDPDHPGDSLGVFASRSQSERQRRSVDARVNARPSGASILTLGAVVEDERESSLSQFQSSFGPFGGAVEASRWNAGLYGQGIIGWDKAHLQVGARYDRNERFGSFLTARAGVVVRPALATRIYAAVGNSFKEPTFIETFGGGFVVGNAALNPERSLSWEVGVEQWVTRNGMALAVTYFDQRFRDIVQYNAAPAQAGDPNYFNVAAATVRGVELEATWLVRPWARLQAHYAYLASEVTNAGFADGPNAEFVDGRRLLRRPTYTMGMMVHAHAGNVVSGVVSARYAGSRDDLDFSSFPFRRVTLPGRTLVDLGAEVRPTPWADIALTVRGENVFGVRYEEVRGFPARGRTVLIGVRIGN